MRSPDSSLSALTWQNGGNPWCLLGRVDVVKKVYFLDLAFGGSGLQASLAPSLDKSVIKRKPREFTILSSSRPEVPNWSAFFPPFSLMIVFCFMPRVFSCSYQAGIEGNEPIHLV